MHTDIHRSLRTYTDNVEHRGPRQQPWFRAPRSQPRLLAPCPQRRQSVQILGRFSSTLWTRSTQHRQVDHTLYTSSIQCIELVCIVCIMHTNSKHCIELVYIRYTMHTNSIQCIELVWRSLSCFLYGLDTLCTPNRYNVSSWLQKVLFFVPGVHKMSLSCVASS